MEILETLKQKVSKQPLTLVFPEGDDSRVVNSAVRLAKEELLTPIVLGSKEQVQAHSREPLPQNLQVLDPETYPKEEFDKLVAAFVERRKGKNTPEQAAEMLKDVNYFGTMLVYLGQADGMVSGAIHSTGATVRPALQIIKTKPNVRRTSGAFLMLRGVEKVVEATKIAQKLAPEEAIDGELQFDAAFVPGVAAKKAPESPVAGKANVFVFPELQSGNIGYKIAQRLGGFEAVGPILQGLNRPVSDLSRGCDEEEVYKVSLITAAQAADGK